MATTVCACVAVAFAIASSCGNLQFSACSREAPKFVDTVEVSIGGGEGSPSAHTARHSPWASIRCVCVINVLNVGVACLGLPAAASRRKCVRCPVPLPLLPCCLGRYLCALVYDSCSEVERGREPLLARSTAAEDLINICGSQKIFRLFRLRRILNFELRFDLHANGGKRGRGRGR